MPHGTYVKFGNRGDKVVATYHGDHAYTFDVAASATSAAAAALAPPSAGAASRYAFTGPLPCSALKSIWYPQRFCRKVTTPWQQRLQHLAHPLAAALTAHLHACSPSLLVHVEEGDVRNAPDFPICAGKQACRFIPCERGRQLICPYAMQGAAAGLAERGGRGGARRGLPGLVFCSCPQYDVLLFCNMKIRRTKM